MVRSVVNSQGTFEVCSLRCFLLRYIGLCKDLGCGGAGPFVCFVNTVDDDDLVRRKNPGEQGQRVGG